MTDSRRRHFARRLASAVAAVALAAVALPASAADDRPPRPGPPPRPATQPADEPRPTAEEQARLGAFMSEHSPNKWAAVQTVAAGRLPLRMNILRRYRQLQAIAGADPERYQAEVGAIAIEDQIFGVLRDIQAGKDPESNEKLLRQRVGELLDNRAAWRKARVERAARELEDLQMKKSADTLREEARVKEQNAERERVREKRIDDRVADFKTHLKPTLRGGGKPGGPPPPPPPGEPAALPEK